MRLAGAVSLVTLLLVLCAVEIRGHGRLRVPPSRTSMWRDGFGTPANYNDNELFCGGSWVSTWRYSMTWNIRKWIYVLFLNNNNNKLTYIAPNFLETKFRDASIENGSIDFKVNKQFQLLTHWLTRHGTMAYRQRNKGVFLNDGGI